MKKFLFLFVFLGLIFTVRAQTVYYNASMFPLLGKRLEQTISGHYHRLPDSLKNISRIPVWNLGCNSSGMAIRFRTNSKNISAKWELLFDNHMNHMSDTGVKGLDLYCLEDDQWRFVNSGRPTGKVNEKTIVSDMEPKEREFMLYLPLYDGIVSLQIGVDSLATMTRPQVDLPKREKAVVFYGTSILQGGCASRPGMAHTNIISRRLNREIINLGFSGNALLDLEVARLMATIDAGTFVLDFVPNASVEQMNERAETFYRILRDEHPATPILFVEDPIFPHTRYDCRVAREVMRKNKTLNEIFHRLKKQGEKNIYFISSKNMLGDDGEATIDGIHFTDVGMMRYADLVCPIIKRVLR